MLRHIRDIEPWFVDGLEIRESPIHGRGLYANRRYERSSAIIRLGGCLFNISQRGTAEVMPSTTTPLSETVLLAEPSNGSKDYSDYLNHSCNPNSGFMDAISIVAIRDIVPGEEIVIDYTFWECDVGWALRHDCRCGAERCRKKVTGRDWMAVKPTDWSFQYFSPFMKRRVLAMAEQGENDDQE